jgi:N-acetylneuraminic acid mutarotase
MTEPPALIPSIVVSGRLYVFGRMPNLSLLAYDPVSDTWTRKSALPTRRDFAAAAGVNGILYVIGGRVLNADYSLRALATVDAYDPVTNTWTTRADMPTPRFGATAGVVNGVVYVIGGFSADGTYLSTVEAYDPTANTWTTKRDMSAARASAAASTVNAIMYVLGGEGTGGPSPLKTLEAYDPISDTWTGKATIPTARSTPVVGVVAGILYVAGGGGDSITPFFATLEAFDPATNSWTTRTPMPTPRTMAVGGVVNGILYVVGGSGYQFGLTTVEAYNPSLDTLGQGRIQTAVCCLTPMGSLEHRWPEPRHAVLR